MSHLLLLHCIILHLYIGITISQPVIRGVVGQAITLPCTYNVPSRDHLTHMCWGKDKCPKSKCSNEILRTNGMQVTSRTSRRYQLNGQITRGDVSLTILSVNNGDNGVYCCRIEVPGWFNDIKKNILLQVDIATTTASTTTITTTPHRIITTITTTPLTTTVVLPTTTPFLSTTESTSPAVPVVVTENNVPTMATSSVSTAIALITASPFDNIKSLTTGFQDESTDDGSRFLVTETLPSSTASTTASAVGITTMSHKNTTIKSNAFLPSTVTPPISPPCLLTTDSISPIISTVALTSTNASAMTTSFGSTATALLTMAPSLVNIKPSPTPLQEERTKNDYLHISEATSSVTGSTNTPKKAAFLPKDTSYNHHKNLILCVTASSVLLLVLLALVIVLKCKQRQKYNLSKRNFLNEQKELAGPEGENGLFIL